MLHSKYLRAAINIISTNKEYNKIYTKEGTSGTRYLHWNYKDYVVFQWLPPEMSYSVTKKLFALRVLQEFSLKK